ncbi:hypothetical protein [Bacteroides salyersiae]|uniref:hypothetical protein n=1 Tax=Bacteroides salyersiae TaxID=291644 RepID=UPI001EFF66A9|nr:hypothetical protein [Bacteroides salyersiae]
MQKNYLYLMVCVIGAMSLASCSEDSISPDAGGDGDGDSTTEVPLAQVAKPKPNPWLAQEEYSITHFNSAQTDAFSSAVKDGTFNIDLSKCQMTWSGPVNLMTLASTSPNYMWGMSSDRRGWLARDYNEDPGATDTYNCRSCYLRRTFQDGYRYIGSGATNVYGQR